METLESFRNIHAAEKIIVCGCGSSLNLLTEPEQYITVGVNDVGRKFDPKYLLVCNYPHQFQEGRWEYMANSRANVFFTHIPDLEVPHPRVVRFSHGTLNGVDFSDHTKLHYTNTSNYMALCLALYMGARRIGIIGVDYTLNHFFGETGRYQPEGEFQKVDQQYAKLYAAVQRRGIKVFNLSSYSRITAFPRMRLEDFHRLSLENLPPIRISLFEPADPDIVY